MGWNILLSVQLIQNIWKLIFVNEIKNKVRFIYLFFYFFTCTSILVKSGAKFTVMVFIAAFTKKFWRMHFVFTAAEEKRWDGLENDLLFSIMF